MKPLNQQETDMLLVLLRKLWRDENGTEQVKRNAKSLFAIITAKMYDAPNNDDKLNF